MKVSGPLMSMEARGKIGERLVFSKRSSGQQARFQKAQKDVITKARTIQRDFYNEAVAMWNALTENQKNVFRVRAENLHMTGYNLHMKEAMKFLEANYLHLTGAEMIELGGFTYQLTLHFSENIVAQNSIGMSLKINNGIWGGYIDLDEVDQNKIYLILGNDQMSSDTVLLFSYSCEYGNVKSSSGLKPLQAISDFVVENNL